MIECSPRAKALLDKGTYRELLGPFDDIESPWLEKQGIVPQADDGMVVAKGTIKGVPTVVVAIEGSFQGGSMGEVSGAKMSAALDLAAWVVQKADIFRPFSVWKPAASAFKRLI